MQYEKIDLYAVNQLARGKAPKGYLYAYVPHQMWEIKKKVRPAVIVCPGGGYEFWSEREGEPVALRFLSAGYAAFVLDYDLNTPHPEPLFQACMAIKYLRENADKYGIEKDLIASVGFSAGGHLAGSFGTLYGEEEITSRLGVSKEQLRPDAVILSYPVITTEEGVTHEGTKSVITGGKAELIKKLSLENAVDAQSSPAFIWHTRTDTCVPVENSYRMALAYQQAGVPYELHIFEHGCHGLSVADQEVFDDGNENILPEVAVWLPLALTWLKGRGFVVKTKNE